MEKQTYRPYPGALLNPRRDFVFKALFTENSDAARKALKSFLTAMIGKEVTDVRLKPNEPSRDEFEGKDVRFDVACTFCDGESADIEAQGKNRDDAFNDRETYLASRLMVHNVKLGQEFDTIKSVYQIGVLNFVMDKTSLELITRYRMRSADGREISDKLNIITLELPKIKNLEEAEIKNLKLYEKWAIFFRDADKKDRKDFVKNVVNSEEGIMGAQEVLDRISLDEIEWKRQFDAEILEMDRATERYEREHWKELAEARGLKEGMERGLKEGMERGLKEGMEKGLKEGRQQGMQQGIEEGRAAAQAEIAALKARLAKYEPVAD